MNDDHTIRLITHLGRGGGWQYYWVKTGGSKRTIWFPSGVVPPVPTARGDIYFSTNPLACSRSAHQRGRVADVAAVNCLFGDFDLDKSDAASAKALLQRLVRTSCPPSAAVFTGGGLHAYWLLNVPFVLYGAVERDLTASILKRWVARVGADPAAADLARVLRVPGTRNYKYRPPAAVTFALANFERTYFLYDLLGLLPPPEVDPTPSRPPHRPPAGDQAQEARRALEHLAPWRCRDYRTWLEVGMSLRSLGAAGLALWEAWSRRCPEKYHPGACAARWKSFDVEGITLASLFHWAGQDRGEETK